MIAVGVVVVLIIGVIVFKRGVYDYYVKAMQQ